MVRKKEEQKVKYPSYQEITSARDTLANELQRIVAGNEGLGVLAKEYRGKRGARKFENLLAAAFSMPEAEAMLEVEGLGTYRAYVSDVRCVIDKDKEPVVMYEILVYRGTSKESQDDPELYYDNSWDWNLMEGIKGGVNKLFDALEVVSHREFIALPDDVREERY